VKKDALRKKKEALQRQVDAAKLRAAEEAKLCGARESVERLLMTRAEKESAAMMNYEEDMVSNEKEGLTFYYPRVKADYEKLKTTTNESADKCTTIWTLVVFEQCH
jgi:hypothetical protein